VFQRKTAFQKISRFPSTFGKGRGIRIGLDPMDSLIKDSSFCQNQLCS